MKKTSVLMGLLVCATTLTHAQEEKKSIFQKIKDRAKGTTEQRVETTGDKVGNKVGDKVDSAVDSLLSGSLFKKKKKKSNTTDETIAENAKSAPQTTTKDNSGVGAGEKVSDFKIYSKFDFIPGEKIIAYEDFSNTNVGDFPLGWNTNSSAEIVKLDGSDALWLSMTKDGYFQPELVKDLPVNFTLEFDVFNRYRSNNILSYQFFFLPSANPRKDLSNDYPQNAIQFNWSACIGSAQYYIIEGGETISQNEELSVKELASTDPEFKEPVIAKFSIWRQNNRLRIYVNENKVLDLPQAFDPKQTYNMFKFGAKKMNFSTNDNKDEFMVANLRYAVGAPDTRHKLITEGKFVTNGILFEIQKADVKPESYAVIKEIASTLKENPTVRIKIIGHASNDGDATANLSLSKLRAAAVKDVLVKEFAIDAARLETEGKGSTEPIDTGNTPTARANNRRVEFIKL